MDNALKCEVEALFRDIAAGRFAAIGADGRIGRLTVDELERTVSECGRRLVPLPDEAWELVDLYAGPAEGSFALDVPLWTIEEGRSDLTLTLSAERSGARFRVTIDDRHVL
jgi:hypothetical protein